MEKVYDTLEETSRCYFFDNVYSSLSTFAASIHSRIGYGMSFKTRTS